MTCFMLKLLLDIFRYGITTGAIHIGMSSWLGFGSWISTSLFGAGRCRCMYCPSQPPPLRWHSVQLRLWLFPVQCGYGIALHSRCWSSTWRHLPGECLAASWMNHDEPWWTMMNHSCGEAMWGREMARSLKRGEKYGGMIDMCIRHELHSFRIFLDPASQQRPIGSTEESQRWRQVGRLSAPSSSGSSSTRFVSCRSCWMCISLNPETKRMQTYSNLWTENACDLWHELKIDISVEHIRTPDWNLFIPCWSALCSVGLL